MGFDSKDEYVVYNSIAKTLTQKDGTLFLGNLKKENVFIPDTVYESINNTIKEFN